MTSTLPSIDPRTGSPTGAEVAETTGAELDAVCAAADSAAAPLEAIGRLGRADVLDAVADALDDRREEVVASADAETALGTTRLTGELARTTYQLRLFAEVLREGSYLEATLDRPGSTPAGPRPDLRRMLVPLGPVAVFAASNFPLAFSVPGGDTASALAAGCPVVVKAHEGHPATSELCARIVGDTMRTAGAPDGSFAVVHGRDAGLGLVRHPAIRSVGFTGSQRGAFALLAAIDERPDPIPFHGELGSLNPVVVTESAAVDRGEEVADGLAASFMLGGGQFCTKPGLVLVPTGPAGDAVTERLVDAVRQAPSPHLLTRGIAEGYPPAVERQERVDGLRVLVEGPGSDSEGYAVRPRVSEVSAAALVPEVLEETFGPATVVVRYTGPKELDEALGALPGSLTTTLHLGADEDPSPHLVDRLRHRSGRIVFGGFPTGVAVAWAQQHGGPWPAANSQHTSVGPTAVRRFLRPVAWQDAPTSVLPAELRDGYDEIPRRIDGVLEGTAR